MIDTSQSIRVALWCMRLGHSAPDLVRWAAAMETQVAEAAKRGAEIPPRSDGEQAGPVLVTDVPVGAIRAAREASTGEVWPGAWDAGHVRVEVLS